MSVPFGDVYEHDDRLKDCPFCGEKGWLQNIEFDDDTVWYNPSCSNCNVMWSENYETKEEAIDKWNKRKVT